MKKYIVHFLVFCLLLISGIVYSQSKKVIERIIEIGKTDNQTMEHLDILCNRFGGRLCGSDAYENAAIWAASKFKEWGMQVEMDEVGEVPVGFNRGPWFGKLLGVNGMNLNFATPSYTSGTKGVQRGHVVIEPKTQAEFDRMKGKLKGAWVLISGKNNGWPIDISNIADQKRDSMIQENAKIELENREIRIHNRNQDNEPKELIPYIEEPALFYRQMVESGILGIIQSSSNPISALYDRKNLQDITFDNLPSIPDIKLDEHQYDIIKQMALEREYFELEFDIRNYFKMGPVKYHNVIGIIPGTKYPDEYVIMGAHLDAFDVATGGVDDGSGVTPIMEAARLIMEAGSKPQKTILVCLWAAEEFGLRGSKSWVEKNKDKLDKISNYFNRDGGPLVASKMSVSSAMYDDMVKICEPLNDINPDFPFQLEIRKEPINQPTTARGSDHAYFAINGVPTINLTSEDIKGYDFNYGEIWHTGRDTYSKSITEYQEHTAIVYAIVVFGVANLNHLLSREGYYTKEETKD